MKKWKIDEKKLDEKNQKKSKKCKINQLMQCAFNLQMCSVAMAFYTMNDKYSRDYLQKMEKR